MEGGYVVNTVGLHDQRMCDLHKVLDGLIFCDGCDGCDETLKRTSKQASKQV